YAQAALSAFQRAGKRHSTPEPWSTGSGRLVSTSFTVCRRCSDRLSTLGSQPTTFRNCDLWSLAGSRCCLLMLADGPTLLATVYGLSISMGQLRLLSLSSSTS